MKNENKGIFTVSSDSTDWAWISTDTVTLGTINCPTVTSVTMTGLPKSHTAVNAIDEIRKEFLVNEKVAENLREQNDKLTKENQRLKNRMDKFGRSIESHAYLSLVLKSLLCDIHRNVVDLEDVEEVLRKNKHLFQ